MKAFVAVLARACKRHLPGQRALLALFAVAGLSLSGALWAADAGIPFMTATPGGAGAPHIACRCRRCCFFDSADVLACGAADDDGVYPHRDRAVFAAPGAGHGAKPAQSGDRGAIVVSHVFFVMSPVLDKIYTQAYLPYNEQKISFNEGLDRAAVPLKDFMLKQTRQRDLAFFY